MNTPRHAGRVLAGTALLVIAALAGALWVTIGMLPGSNGPAKTPTVHVQQAAANSTPAPTVTVTKKVTVHAKTTKPKKVTSVTQNKAQAAPQDNPAPTDTSADLPANNGSGHGPVPAPDAPTTLIPPPSN